MACSKGLVSWLLIIMGTLLVDHQSSVATLFPSPFNIPSCPNAATIIKSIVGAAVLREPRMGASLLRLHFHDCFVNGCDGSVLLDDTLTFLGEKSAAPNANSARGFDVIDNIKAALELACPRTVSCADILAIAARDSVVFLGGPSWNVNTGRQDAITASFLAANNDLPTPTMDVNALISNFANKGFTPNEMVALSGSHTIGQSRCVRFRDHIYNDTNIDGLFQLTRRFTCPTNRGDDNLAPLDWFSPNTFDNSYFRNLMSRKGLLHSDQELFNNGPVDSQVAAYAANPSAFQQDFANAMVKMSNLQPSPGTITEIRTNCRRPNSG